MEEEEEDNVREENILMVQLVLSDLINIKRERREERDRTEIDKDREGNKFPHSLLPIKLIIKELYDM